MSDLNVWVRATDLLREHGERVEQAAQRAVVANGGGQANDDDDALLRSVGALLRAAMGCRQPALYMRFNWDDAADEQLELERFRHDCRTDFGFQGLDDIPHCGPLIVLQASTADAARAVAERYWDDRARMGPTDAAPDDYSIISEAGLLVRLWNDRSCRSRHHQVAGRRPVWSALLCKVAPGYA